MRDAKAPKEKRPAQSASACGATHTDCVNTIQGTCERPVGHDGSHLCSSCKSMF